MAYAGSGRIDEGSNLLQQADEQVQAIGSTFGHVLVQAQLGEALLLAGDWIGHRRSPLAQQA